MTRRRLRPVDSGRASVFLAIGLGAVLAVVGLAFDGAGRLRAMHRADNLAAEAARAGGQAIEVAPAVQGGEKLLDEAEAEAAARAYLDDVGVEGWPEVADDRRSISIEVEIVYEPVMLGLFGFPSMNVHGSATAVLVTG